MKNQSCDCNLFPCQTLWGSLTEDTFFSKANISIIVLFFKKCLRTWLVKTFLALVNMHVNTTNTLDLHVPIKFSKWKLLQHIMFWWVFSYWSRHKRVYFVTALVNAHAKHFVIMYDNRSDCQLTVRSQQWRSSRRFICVITVFSSFCSAPDRFLFRWA